MQKIKNKIRRMNIPIKCQATGYDGTTDFALKSFSLSLHSSLEEKYCKEGSLLPKYHKSR